MKFRVIRADGTVAYDAKELNEVERNLLTDLGCKVTPVPHIGTAIEDAQKVMVAQREKGMKKYGVPIEDSNLSALELIRGAQEEVADAAVYLVEGLRRAQRDSQQMIEDLANLGVLVEWDGSWKVQYDPECVMGAATSSVPGGKEYLTVMLRVPV